MKREVLSGNEAIALGLVEQGCRVVTSYPGTPSSEILAGVIKYKKQLARQVYTEWSVNEKVAFEIALAASWTGLRAAVAMKQVGLSVPLLKIGTPYPLPQGLILQFMAGLQTVVVLEEPDACIELQLPDRSRVRGRLALLTESMLYKKEDTHVDQDPCSLSQPLRCTRLGRPAGASH